MERPSALQRLRAALFASPLDGLITVVLLAALLAGGQALLHWLVFKAQWAVIQVNSTLFAVGRYPLDQQWRLWLLTTLLAGATGLSWGLLRALPRPDRRAVLWPTNDRLAVALLSGLGVLVPLVLQLSAAIALRWWLITALVLACRWLAGRWGAALPAIARRGWPLIWPLLYLLGMTLIAGGFGVPAVSPYRWGGLLLTLIEACFAILLCFPLGVLLALGRRRSLPLLRWLSVLYIEFIRGAPLITLLFLGQNILGLLLPGGFTPDRVWRAAWVLTFFAAAYVAEAVRSGLVALPPGQMEAGKNHVRYF